MNLYDVLCEINWMQIMKKKISKKKKQEVIALILSSIYKTSSNNPHSMFFKYTGEKRFICINGIMPKTKLLLDNHFEFEILRILALWCSDNDTVANMFNKTKNRIKSMDNGTFGNTNESIETSISALRFLSVAFIDEKEWIDLLIKHISKNIKTLPNGKKRNSLSTYYFWLCLSEIESEISLSEIEKYESLLINQTSRSVSYQIEFDKIYNPLALYTARNCLGCLPNHADIMLKEGYETENGRYALK
ncbi:MAG: hypothetical protein PHV32_00435 [Eubacteriales bacterium]|nr:hypothetical protein [Eubacteriales bacterium]